MNLLHCLNNGRKDNIFLSFFTSALHSSGITPSSSNVSRSSKRDGILSEKNQKRKNNLKFH